MRRFGGPRRFPRSRSTLAAIVSTAIVLTLAGVRQWRPEMFSPQADTNQSANGENVKIARVVDGDTLVLAGSKERVRLIGADTPETVKPNFPVQPWGPEASAFTKKFVSGGKVRLEFDVERRDKYGRMLAYIWVGERMLNEELIRAGLARAELKYRYSAEKKSRFRRAEEEARAAHRGIWSDGNALVE
jgi:micrococcal nuclease